MKAFADKEMPEYIEHIVMGSRDLEKFEEKAIKNGLPRAILFTSKPNTSPISKFLSTEFRRRMLIAEIKPTKKNKDIIDQFQIKDFPALLVIPPPSNSTTPDEEEPVTIRYSGKDTKDFSKHRLITFLSEHALKQMVMPKKKSEEETPDPSLSSEQGSKTRNEKVRTEL